MNEAAAITITTTIIIPIMQGITDPPPFESEVGGVFLTSSSLFIGTPSRLSAHSIQNFALSGEFTPQLGQVLLIRSPKVCYNNICNLLLKNYMTLFKKPNMIFENIFLTNPNLTSGEKS